MYKRTEKSVNSALITPKSSEIQQSFYFIVFTDFLGQDFGQAWQRSPVCAP